MERLSGVKADTIRKWESRYSLFEHGRDSGSVRSYEIADLQKLFNVQFLIRQGYKISAISKMTNTELAEGVRLLAANLADTILAVDQIKTAMMSFDTAMFNEIYFQLLKTYHFPQILLKVFYPFLDFVGTLWQTNLINPAHEHFISQLIKQKILVELEKLPEPDFRKKKGFALYLPYGELHDIGLLALTYQIKAKGYPYIYIGENTGIEILLELGDKFEETVYVSYLTMDHGVEYFEKIKSEWLSLQSIFPNSKCHAFGPKAHRIRGQGQLPDNQTTVEEIIFS